MGVRLWSLGSQGAQATTPARVHLGATTFPSRIRVIGYSAVQQQSPLRRDIRFPQVPFSVPTITDGYARTKQGFTIHLALSRPDCTLRRLFAVVAEEYDRPVTQSIAPPEPGCPGPHPRSSRSLASDVREEYSTCQTRTGRPVLAGQSDPLFEPAKLLIMTPTPSTEVPAQEKLLQKYKRTSGKALTTRSSDKDLYGCRIPDNS